MRRALTSAGLMSQSRIQDPLLAEEEGFERTACSEAGASSGSEAGCSPCSGNSSFSGGVANLAVTAVGAGMLAMPKAYSTVGIALGAGITALASALTYFSSAVIVRYCAKSRLDSYGALVRKEFGASGGAILETSICMHVLGVMVVYLIIISDMLVGSPSADPSQAFRGILPYFLGRHDGPWWLSRSFVSAAVLLGAACPMLVSRDLSQVSRFSRASIVMMLGLAAALFGLAASATAQHKRANIHVLPQAADMGGSTLGVLSSLLSILAVNALAFTLQFNLVPVHNSLQDNCTPVMLCITRRAITVCALLYACVGMAGYTLFGAATEGDVLKNLTVRNTAALVGQVPAELLIPFIVGANTANLLVNFVLKVWAVRESCAELLLQRSAATLSPRQWYSLTALLVGASYLVSVLLPSIWLLISLVGSTACVTFSYVFPGLLAMRRAPSLAGRAAGAGAVVLAALMASIAVFNTVTGHADL